MALLICPYMGWYTFLVLQYQTYPEHQILSILISNRRPFFEERLEIETPFKFQTSRYFHLGLNISSYSKQISSLSRFSKSTDMCTTGNYVLGLEQGLCERTIRDGLKL